MRPWRSQENYSTGVTSNDYVNWLFATGSGQKLAWQHDNECHEISTRGGDLDGHHNLESRWISERSMASNGHANQRYEWPLTVTRIKRWSLEPRLTRWKRVLIKFNWLNEWRGSITAKDRQSPRNTKIITEQEHNAFSNVQWWIQKAILPPKVEGTPHQIGRWRQIAKHVCTFQSVPANCKVDSSPDRELCWNECWLALKVTWP